MRTQPEYIITQLEIHNSRLDKEGILEAAMTEGLDEFFEGVRMCLDKLYTFGVKQVPTKEEIWEDGTEVNGILGKKLAPNGQGLSWDVFKQLAESLSSRQLTGHAARDAIQLCMETATTQQWNDWYRRILIKDLRCGVSEKTVNKVAKKLKKSDYAVPVFECMLAHDGANHENKITGKKLVEPKLDGVRCLTVIDHLAKTVTQYTRNGNELLNFTHITSALEPFIDSFGRSYVLDGEVVSNSFQDLMKQVHRKSNVQAEDAKLMLFDIIPLSEFKQGKSTLGQKRRTELLKTFAKVFEETGCVDIVPQRQFDLDVFTDEIEFKDYNKEMVEAGFEGIMVKDPDAKYECKRSTSWLKIKPWIEVSLEVKDVEEGTGRNEGRLGAFVCEGVDDGKKIVVNVGSGFTDNDRSELWEGRDTVLGQVVEIRADAITQNQDGTYSLRFPRFQRFRGFKAGEKI